MSEQIRVVITGDSTQAERALDRVDDALNRLGTQASTATVAAPGMARLAQGVKGVGDQSRYAREQMRNLSYQMTDIVTGLATGQNPFYVLLQQGGQLKDTFGGVLPALRAVASVFTLVRVAAGGVAGAIGAFAIASIQGARESEALNKALAATGNAAQVTAGQYEAAVRSISAGSKLGAGDVRDLAEAFVATGKLSAGAFEPAVRAAAAYAKATGASVEDTTKRFADLTQDAYKWATGMANAYRAVSAARLEEIRQLQAQGRSQEAIKLASDSVAEAITARIVPSQYAVVRGWEALTKAISDYWDKLKGFARDETPEGRLESLLKKQQEREAARAAGALPGAGIFRDEARELAQIRALQSLVGSSRRARDQLAANQSEDAQERQAMTDASISATNALTQAGVERRLAIEQNGLDRAKRAYASAREQFLIDEAGYQRALIEIELSGIKLREEAIKSKQALEGRKKPTTPDETRAQQAARLGYETELVRLAGERQAILDKIEPDLSPRDMLRRMEAAALPEDAPASADRATAAQKRAEELRDINARLSVKLIADTEARGMALIALDERFMLERLDLDAMSATQRKEVEDDLAQWRMGREKRLTDQLKPVWQQQLEEWRNIKKLQADADEEMWGGVLRNAEDAWVQLVTTGKLSLSNLVREFVAAQARMQFRKFVSGFDWGSLLSSAFSFGSSPTSNASPTGGTGISFGGARAAGGDAHAGMLHRINERGVPEVLTVKGKDYLATGAASGKVTPMKAAGAVISAPINQTLYIDSRTDQAQVAQIAMRAVEMGQAQLLDNLRANRVIA